MARLLALIPVAIVQTYSVAPSALALQASGDCGFLGMSPCQSVDRHGWTINSCFSDGHPTVSAVVLPENSTYMCEMCGRPGTLACECTHDNNKSLPDHFRFPCAQKLEHWCFFEPQYVVSEGDDGFFRCIHNTTDDGPELRCGAEGEEACLNTYDGVYSCASPAPDGATVRAVQPADSDVSTSTFVCERCGVDGARACVCTSGTACPNGRGTAAWCDDGLEFLTNSTHGDVYCTHQRPEELH